MLKSAYRALALVLVLVLAPLHVAAHVYKAGDISIDHPWSRATPKGVPTGAGYLSIENNGAVDRLVSAECACSTTTEIHIMKREGDVIQMHALPDGLSIPANDSYELQPGGAHLMFIGLKQQLQANDEIKVRLVFEKAGPLNVTFKVSPLRKRK
jgi:hypothetical protein